MTVRESTETSFYTGAGPLAALLLGMALIPLRGVTNASNLAFAFMALTLVVAELGGPSAAIATALVSALGLDFFLTEPYLSLAIQDKEDIAAFAGLAVCGLIAASLAAQRSARIAALNRVRKHHELLRGLLKHYERSLPPEPQIGQILRAACNALPLAAAVARDPRGRVVGASDDAAALRPVPEAVLDSDTILPIGGAADRAPWETALPDRGARISLGSPRHPFGWLDVWGNGRDAAADSRRALSDVARLVGILLPR